jgi:Skp family chaperone for outer membrane proteins
MNAEITALRARAEAAERDLETLRQQRAYPTTVEAGVRTTAPVVGVTEHGARGSVPPGCVSLAWHENEIAALRAKLKAQEICAAQAITALRARAEAAEKLADEWCRARDGAFAVRDQWRTRAEAAEAKLAEATADHVRFGNDEMPCSRQLKADLMGWWAEMDRRTNAANKEAAALKAEIEVMKAKLAESEKDRQECRQADAATTAKVLADRDRLAAEVERLTRECSDKDAFIRDGSRLRVDAEADARAAWVERDRLAAEVVDLQRQQKASDDEIARVNGERDKLLANISALKAALKRYDDASAELAALKARKVKLPNPLGPDEYGEYSYEQQPLIAAIRAAGVEVEP